MSSIKKSFYTVFILLFSFMACKKEYDGTQPESMSDSPAESRTSTYTMPAEFQPHEGTWLQWPHQFQYGTTYRNRLDATWVEMTRQLVGSEKVHIIAYNASEKSRIITKLNAAGIALTQIDFKIIQTNDVWVRDNGPIYARNANNQWVIQDWGFNGWGNKAPYSKDNTIPTSIGTATNIGVVNLNSSMKIEGGSYEIDGAGAFLATKSSILNPNRNPGMTQAQAEAILADKLGVSKFIWLNGVAGLEITDMHIDGFARFANSNTLVTMNNSDLLYWEVPQSDINTLFEAKNAANIPYNKVFLPLTQQNVVTAYGKNLGYKGSYVNFYEANNKVLMPFYNDPNDQVAKNLLQAIYPTKTVVGIDVRNLYENGGMVHCVTQQQPL